MLVLPLGRIGCRSRVSLVDTVSACSGGTRTAAASPRTRATHLISSCSFILDSHRRIAARAVCASLLYAN